MTEVGQREYLADAHPVLRSAVEGPRGVFRRILLTMAESTHNLALASAEAKLRRGLITQAEYEHILETNREIAAMEGVLQVRNLDTGSSQTMTLTDIDSIFDTFGTAMEPVPTRLLSTVEEAEEHEASFHSAQELGPQDGAEADDDLEGLADAEKGT